MVMSCSRKDIEGKIVTKPLVFKKVNGSYLESTTRQPKYTLAELNLGVWTAFVSYQQGKVAANDFPDMPITDAGVH